MQSVLDFLNRVEGHGYGGTAEFEIARSDAEDAKAEIERLRAALQKIADVEPSYDYDSAEEPRRIAQDALNQQGPQSREG